MALLKSRPRITLKVPAEIRPGDVLHAVVVLTCRRAVAVEEVSVAFEGIERWQFGSGSSTRTQRRSLLLLGAQLSGARSLPAGTTELPLRIPLPADAPPSYRGRAAHIEYELRVHTAIDWWPDARAAFEIKVAPLAAPSPPSEPALYSSNPEGPRAQEPHAELSLTSAWTRAGEVVSGALALSNVGHNRYSEIKAGLRALETLYDTRGRPVHEQEHLSYRIRLGAEQAREGEMIPFTFRLPSDVVPELPPTLRPGAQPMLSSLRWQLEVVVGIRWGSDLTLRVPFRVLPESTRPGDAPMRAAPPTVGTDRLQALWEAIGHEHGLRYEGQALVGRFGDTLLVVRREHAGRAGTFVVAELSYPELHLDLSVAPAAGLRKMVGGGVVVGDAGWDRDHYVVARDEAQAASFLSPLLSALSGATLRRLDDRQLTVELRDSGQSRARLPGFVAGAIALARRFEQARLAIPPPTAMRDVVERWRTLARGLNAPLETARMRIDGQLGAHGAEVRIAFDDAGQPLSTWLSVRPSTPLDAAHGFAWAARQGPFGDFLPSRVSRVKGELAQLLASVADGATELSVEPARIAVCLPAPLGLQGPDERVIEVEVGEPRLERMAQLANLLRGEAGPYR